MIGALYEEALAGDGPLPVVVEYADGTRVPLPVERWLSLRPGDGALLDRCAGPVLDVGCGPGRLVTELAARGTVVLGIDVTPGAVALTAAAGGSVLLRDVFDRVPATGRWATVLLADGNVGIGGDPAALLRRGADLLGPGGRLVVEAEAPGTGLRRVAVRLRAGSVLGPWFPWAHVAVDALRVPAASAGLAVVEVEEVTGRWLAVLQRA